MRNFLQGTHPNEDKTPNYDSLSEVTPGPEYREKLAAAVKDAWHVRPDPVKSADPALQPLYPHRG